MPPALTNEENSADNLKEGNPVASKEREILTSTIRLPSLESSFAPTVSSTLPKSSLSNYNYGSASSLSNAETVGIQPSLFYLPTPPVLQQQSNLSFSSSTAFHSNAAVQPRATSPSNAPKHFDSIPPF